MLTKTKTNEQRRSRAKAEAAAVTEAEQPESASERKRATRHSLSWSPLLCQRQHARSLTARVCALHTV